MVVRSTKSVLRRSSSWFRGARAMGGCLTLAIAVCIASTAPAQPLAPAPTPAPTPADGAPGGGADEAPAPGYLGMIGDLAPSGGVVVRLVRPDSPAEAAGLRAGDVLERANGTELRALDQFGAIVGRIPAGGALVVEVRRDGTLLELQAILATRAADQPLGPIGDDSLPAPSGAASAANSAPVLGVVVRSVEEVRERLGLSLRSGAYVESIGPGSPASTAGLPAGAVIVRADTTRIDNVEDLANFVQGARAGQTVQFGVYVGEEPRDIAVTLAARASGAVAGPGASGAGGATPYPPVTGASSNPGTAPGAGADPRDAELARLRNEVTSLRQRVEQLERLLAPKPVAPGPVEGTP